MNRDGPYAGILLPEYFKRENEAGWWEREALIIEKNMKRCYVNRCLKIGFRLGV